MRSDCVWYHVIWNTHGSWLPGDPRGFRDHDHRIHSSGDYKTPPPAGEHAGLLRHHEERSGPAVVLPIGLRSTVVEAVLDAIGRRDCTAAAVSVSDQHVHLLAKLPPDFGEAKTIVGKIKTISSLALRANLPGAVWSRGCHLKRVESGEHWDATYRYVTEKQERAAVLWNWGGVKNTGVEESTAPAAASPVLETPDATAEAVDSPDAEDTSDPNHFTQSTAVEVRRVLNRGKGGRAVMARRDIAAGELIERVPVLMIPRTQVFGPGDIAQRASRISWYVFEWLETKRGYVALSLGYGSIYNHSDDPNAEYDMELPDVMTFTALRPIKAGEEVLISYAGAEGVMKELGFEAKKNPPLAVDESPKPSGGDEGADDSESV